MDYLASVTDLKVFGCSIDFLQTATQTYLEDPIWDRPQQGMAYTVVFKDSSVILPSQEQLEGCPVHHVPLAVHVPMNPEEIVPEGAFAGVPRLRMSVLSYQAHWSRGLAKLSTAPHCQIAGHCCRHF